MHKSLARTAVALLALAALPGSGPAPDASTTNEIRLRLAPSELSHAQALNDRYHFQHAEAIVNGAGPFPADLNIRGQNCLDAIRKCFGLKLEQPVELAGDSDFSSNSMFLVSMWRDSGYISSKMGFEMFKALDLFTLRTEYAEVFVNDASQGLYLVAEKPKSAIEREMPGAFVGRRGTESDLEVVESVPKGSRHTDAQYVGAFDKLYEDVRHLQGRTLEVRLDHGLDLNSYMSWLMVNSLLANGDFTDEVFFYADSRERLIHFRIFPWDLDDLFKEPHPSEPNRRYADQIATGLLYSYEDPLDEKIGTDPVLHEQLTEIADRILRNQLTDGLVDGVVDEVARSIAPYLTKQSVFDGSSLDRDVPYTRAGILKLLESRRRQIKSRRDVLLSRLQN